MVLDLDKLSELEIKYKNNDISLNALHNMVMLVTHDTLTTQGSLALLTLIDLGVIKKDSKSQQLNS